METLFHMIVRIAGAAYILYKVWILLFRDRLFGLWGRILTPTERKEAKPVDRRPENKVLGRTNRIILDDPRKAAPEPAASSELEPTGFIGRDEPVAAEDVETPEPPDIPSDEELYEDAPPPDDNGMSSGLTFDELSDAVEVLKNGTRDEEQRTEAAITLHGIWETGIMDFLLCEVCSAEAIENLFKECLDGDGFPLKKRNSPAGFDIRNYV